MKQFPYEDIINMPHHVSKKHPRMPMIDRAAQFSAFRALSGYEAAIQETARLTEEQIELDEDYKAEMDRKLRGIMELSAERPAVTILYFQPDEKKQGGAYRNVTGEIKRIDDVERTVILRGGQKILVENIIDVKTDFNSAVQD